MEEIAVWLFRVRNEERMDADSVLSLGPDIAGRKGRLYAGGPGSECRMAQGYIKGFVESFLASCPEELEGKEALAKVDALLDALEFRFGPLLQRERARIGEAPEEQLDAWIAAMPKARSLRELLGNCAGGAPH